MKRFKKRILFSIDFNHIYHFHSPIYSSLYIKRINKVPIFKFEHTIIVFKIIKINLLLEN